VHASSIHIVRRYGPVGGMESYVYQLTMALAKKGQPVTVLCEQDCRPGVPETHRHPVSEGLTIVVLPNPCRKPRWLAQWSFSRAVERYLATPALLSQERQSIIHSHERTAVHHVTTFHGPPFLMRKRRLLDGLSPRIHMWTFLERRELESKQVLAILPNSPLISEQLQQLYPAIADKVLAPAYPGVDPRFAGVQRSSNGMTIGFLGREWKRKGLDIAANIVRELRQRLATPLNGEGTSEDMSPLKFVVAGCDPEEVRPLLADWPKDSYELMGWIDDPACLLERIDVLLHPARAEPFGMVITEANAAGIPVVMSDQCGVAALIQYREQGKVCDLGGPIDHWLNACEYALSNQQLNVPVPSFDLSWDGLADQHIDVYQHLLNEQLS